MEVAMSAFSLGAADLDRAGVLVVGVDGLIRRELVSLLGARGARVVEAGDGPEALWALHRGKPDVVALRVGSVDGWEVLDRLRVHTRRPVLTLGMSTDELTPVRALRAGADDHLRIPFFAEELVARLAVLVRWSRETLDADTDDVYADERLEVDFTAVEVRGVDGQPLGLPPLEYRLLATLVRRAGEVVGTHELAFGVWGDHATAPERLRRVVRRLRFHLRSAGIDPRCIEAVEDHGYRYRPPPRR
jgi:DNA-binding response OmpR family regulator